MTEHENSNEVPLYIDAGTLLKNKRESLGMTQKQIADRLRLRVAVIQEIESNCFDAQQVATFTRGYLRSYAKVVGLDEKLVLSALQQTEEVLPPQEQEIEMQSFSRKTKHEKHNSRIMLLTWIIGIVIVCISAAWWWQNQKENSLTKEVADSSIEAPRISAEEIADIDLMTAEELIASTPQEIASTTEDVIEIAEPEVPVAKAEVVEEEQPLPETQEVPEVPQGMTFLTMKFKADCWVQVKDSNGKTLVIGTRKSGEGVELSGKAPFNVILGAPEAVTMTFASEPVDLSRYTSGKVARFTLPL